MPDDVLTTPASVDPAETPTPAEPAGEAAEPEPEVPEGAIEQGGQVMVPLAALKSEREKVKALKPKADQYEQLAGWVQQAKPYVDFLAAHPELVTRAAAPAAEPTTPAGPAPDDTVAEQLAKTLDLYTTEGKPDLSRAKSLIGTVEALAEKKAQALVKPVQDLNVQGRAMAHYHEAVAASAPNGAKVDPAILWQVWQNADPRILATPQGAAAAWALALGMASMQAAPTPRTVAAPGGPPVVTEPPGGSGVRAGVLSDLDQRVVQVRGMDPKKYQEYARAFKPGETNTVEE